MSDIKPEVETVIKEGRKQAEEQPELTPRIDALKELYNRLGSEITSAKGSLETALELSKCVVQDLEDLTSWSRELTDKVDDNSDDVVMLKVQYKKKKNYVVKI